MKKTCLKTCSLLKSIFNDFGLHSASQVGPKFRVPFDFFDIFLHDRPKMSKGAPRPPQQRSRAPKTVPRQPPQECQERPKVSQKRPGSAQKCSKGAKTQKNVKNAQKKKNDKNVLKTAKYHTRSIARINYGHTRCATLPCLRGGISKAVPKKR